MAFDPETFGGMIGAGLAGLLGKLGWDKYKKQQQQQQIQIEADELNLERPFTRNESIAVWISERIHKAIDALNPHFNRLNLEDARLTKELGELTIRFTHLEKEVEDNKRESDTRISDIHRHIEAGNTRLEQSFKREVDRVYDLMKEIRDTRK